MKTSQALLLATVSAFIILYCFNDVFFRRNMDMKLRVAWPLTKDLREYDPTNIVIAPDYILLENIYSPLLEKSSETGVITSAIAEKYFWDKDTKLILNIRKDLRTIEGHSLTALDVEASLKRVMILSRNLHGNLKEILCPDVSLNKLSDKCENIQVIDEFTISLNPKSGSLFLIEMLTSMDFAIIPRSSLDEDTLEIIDYKNTSGLYYVDKDNGEGNLILKVNPHHFNFHSNIPQEIEFITPAMYGLSNSLELFKRDLVDHITTVDLVDKSELIDYAKNDSSTNLHQTLNILNYYLKFSPEALETFSKKERLEIGVYLRERLSKYYEGKSGFKNELFFLPRTSEIIFPQNQEDELKKVLSEHLLDTIADKKIVLEVAGTADVEKVKKLIPEIEILDRRNNKGEASKKAHIYLLSTDVTIDEDDISFVSYTINRGIFGMTLDERQKWLTEYIAIEDRDQRIKELQKVHYEALLSGVLFPVASAPYVALARNKWKPKLSMIYAFNQFGRIFKEM